MKDLKSIFTQLFLISSVGSALILAFMTLPFLAGIREKAAAPVGGNPGVLWLAAIGLLLGLQFFVFRRSLATVARPMSRLAREIEHGEQGFAFRTKAKSKEEDSLKHAIEATNLRSRETREQADDLESELEQTQANLERAESKVAEFKESLQEFDSNCRELRVENETLKASKAAVELTLDNERKSKVGVEIEKRTEEIYRQMERAISAAAYKSLWVPSIVHELKTPISIIQEISNKLNETWTQSSISQVSEELGKIQKQSLAQLEILDDILSRRPDPTQEPPSSVASSRTDETTSHEQTSPAEDTPAVILEAPAKPSSIAHAEAATSLNSTEAIPVIDDCEPEPSEPTRSFSHIELPPILTESEPAAIADAPQTPPESPYELKNLLKNLVNEFSLLAEDDVVVSYAMDEDLEIEIEDENLLNLLHSLTDTAVSATKRGDVVIGIELRRESIVFDLACDGELRPHPSPMSLNKAEQSAKALHGQIEVESTSPNELHLTFEYVFQAAQGESPVFDLES